MAAPRALVLGIGNRLLGDEGVGGHVVDALERESRPAGVDLLDGGTGGFHLLGLFRDYPLIVLIDATLDGRPAGTVTTLRPRFLSDYPRTLSAHDIGLRDLLETAALLGPLPDVRLITVSIAEVAEATVALSSGVAAALPETLRAVQAALTAGLAEASHDRAS